MNLEEGLVLVQSKFKGDLVYPGPSLACYAFSTIRVCVMEIFYCTVHDYNCDDLKIGISSCPSVIQTVYLMCLNGTVKTLKKDMITICSLMENKSEDELLTLFREVYYKYRDFLYRDLLYIFP
jgi:hypothetical protein